MAALTNGLGGQWRVNQVLGALADAGVVRREHRPPAKLYRLNRDHVAADGIIALASQWDTLLSRIRADLASWAPAPVSACLFGSAARAEAGSDSDLDILLVTSDEAHAADHLQQPEQEQQRLARQTQSALLVERVRLWSGNACELLELSLGELRDAVGRRDRLVEDLRADAVTLAGRDIRTLLRPDPRREDPVPRDPLR